MTQPKSDQKPLRVGIAGLGTVGGGLVKVIRDNADLIQKRTGRRIEITAVLERNMARVAELGFGPETPVYQNVAKFTGDPNVDVIVELIGGMTFAHTVIESALNNCKHVVTANKALLAEDGIPLMRLAAEKGLNLRYEASVCGAIPIVDALRVPMAGIRVSSMLGILNGTSNYILSQMTTNGSDFDSALQEAQRLGYAEADPTLDIDGQDAAHKLTILIRMAFGVNYPFSALPVKGIRGMSSRDIAMAREFGYRIKLVGQVRRVNPEDGDNGPIRLEAGVFPALVHDKFLLAKVGGVYNAVRVDSEASGPLFFHGRGAGDLPTASVVLGDIMAIARGDRQNNAGFADPEIHRCDIMPPEESRSQYYVRVMVHDEPGVLRDIADCMAKENISMARVIQSESEGKVVPLVFMTHECSTKEMNDALQHAMDAGLLHESAVYYRVLAQDKQSV